MCRNCRRTTRIYMQMKPLYWPEIGQRMRIRGVERSMCVVSYSASCVFSLRSWGRTGPEASTGADQLSVDCELFIGPHPPHWSKRTNFPRGQSDSARCRCRFSLTALVTNATWTRPGAFRRPACGPRPGVSDQHAVLAQEEVAQGLAEAARLAGGDERGEAVLSEGDFVD